MEFSFFLTDTRRVVCKSQFCFLKEFRRKHSSLPSMNTENRIKAIRSCFENWTMRCILCPMNTVSLSFFRSSQQFQCSRQSASAEPQCGFYKKMNLPSLYHVFDLKIVGEPMKRIISISMPMSRAGVKIEASADCEVRMI